MTSSYGSRRSLSTCAALAVTLLLTVPAQAAGVLPSQATPAQRKAAMDHFTAGKQAFEASKWDQSVAELRASLDIVNSPNTRLELARALRDSGALGDAWTEYGHVIDDATSLAAKEERYAKTADAATAERADVEGKIAFLTITVQHAPPDAVLKVGGRTIPREQWTSPVITVPGPVDVVVVDGAGKELARQSATASGGQQSSVTIDAVPPRAMDISAMAADDKPDFGKPKEAPPPTPSNGPNRLRAYSYVAGGVGIVGLGLFAAFGAMSNSDFNDLKNVCTAGRCPANKAGEINDGRTFQTVADVALGVGIAGVAAGVTLFVLGSSSKPQTTGLVVGPSYIGWRGAL